jgi:hypothetical protein
MEFATLADGLIVMAPAAASEVVFLVDRALSQYANHLALAEEWSDGL